ncbi:MAG: hypothetical protein QM751_06160 [Paludibacteraceae bacterium]
MAVAGNAVGSLVGLPVAGTFTVGLINKMGAAKAAKLKAAVQSSGHVDPVKAKETIQQITGKEPTNAEIAEYSNDVAQAAGVPVANSPYTKTDSEGNSKPKFKLMDFVKKYWYAIAGGLAVIAYFIFKPKSNSKRRY